jgi:hypothetical protein
VLKRSNEQFTWGFFFSEKISKGLSKKEFVKQNFVQRSGISDVCRSVAEANMGGGFCKKP